MNDNTTLEVIAPTVEEALAQGLAQLGLPAEAVRVEVLDAGTKGLFGLGGRQVRVRLTVAASEEKAPISSASPGSAKSKPKPARKKREASKPKEPKEPKPRAATTIVDAETAPVLDLTEETISKLLYHLNLQAQVSAHIEESDRDDRQTVYVDVRGDDLGILIGRRSETLNAFQYVASLMVGKQVQQWVHLVVDVEGYRSRRERQLRQMARRMAEQVIKSGRRQAMEPMPASERRLIHLELREHPAVTTESVGEEPYRKVTIIPKD